MAMIRRDGEAEDITSRLPAIGWGSGITESQDASSMRSLHLWAARAFAQLMPCGI